MIFSHKPCLQHDLVVKFQRVKGRWKQGCLRLSLSEKSLNLAHLPSCHHIWLRTSNSHKTAAKLCCYMRRCCVLYASVQQQSKMWNLTWHAITWRTACAVHPQKPAWEWHDAIVQLRVFADPYLWWRRAGWGQSLAAAHWQSRWRRGCHRHHTATNCTVPRMPAHCNTYIHSFICLFIQSFICLFVIAESLMLSQALHLFIHTPIHPSVHIHIHVFNHWLISLNTWFTQHLIGSMSD